MKPKKELMLAGLLVVVGLFASGVTAQDCHKINSREVKNCESPGEYDDTKMNTTHCRVLCGWESFAYSSTQAGKYCFCCSAAPDTAKVTPSATYCTDKCTGGTEKCGGGHYITSFPAIAELKKPWMEITKTIKETGTEIKPTFGVTGINEKFTFNFDNDAGTTDACFPTGFKNTDSGNVKVVYHIPGVYDVTYAVSSPSVPTLTAAAGLVVQSKLTDFYLECPTTVAKSLDLTKRDEEFNCTAKVFVGSSIKATLDFKDGTKSENVVMNDPLYTTAGPGIPQYGTCTKGVANRVYVMPGSEFTEDGTIIGWEFNIQTVGDLKLLILEPACTGGEAYCLDTFTCETTTCAVSCTYSSESFCTSRNMCTPKSLGACPASPRSRTPTFGYRVKHVLTVTAAQQKLGYNYIDKTAVSSTSLNVTKGMKLAYATNSGIIGTVASTTTPLDYSKAYAVVSEGDTITQASLDISVTTNKRILLRAISSTPSTVVFFHHYQSTGSYAVSLSLTSIDIPKAVTKRSVTSNANTVTKTRTIASLEGIDKVPLNIAAVVEAGASTIVRIDPHKGMAISCHYLYNFNDSSPIKRVDGVRIVQHTFVLGKYNVSVEGKNAISAKTNFSLIEAKDKIGTITVTTPMAVMAESATITIVITKGTGYNCTVDFGDSNVTVYTDQQIPLTTGSVRHIYKNTGTFTVKVNCKNGLLPHPAEITKPIEVQEKITTFDVVPPGAKKGEPVQVKLTTNLQNGHGTTFTCTVTPDFNAGVPIDLTSCKDSPSCTSNTFNNVVVQVYKLACRAENQLGGLDKNIDFTIDGPIENPELKISKICNQVTSPPGLDGVYLLVPSCVDFRASITSGTNAFVSIDYGDTVSSGQKKFVDANPQLLNHVYNNVGIFTAKGTIGSGDGVRDYIFKINAFKPMDLSCVDEGPQGTGVVNMKFTSNGPPPPDIKYVTDFGDGQKSASTPFEINTPISHSFRKPNTYTVSTVFSNPVETITKTCTVVILEAIENPKFFVMPEHAALGTTASLLIQVDKGTDMKVILNWGYPSQPGTDLTFDYKKSTTPSFVAGLKFDILGQYTVKVKLYNKLSSFTHTHVINCQHPVVKGDYKLATTAPVKISSPTVMFTLTWAGSQAPTAPSHEVQYGKTADGKLAFSLDYTGAKSKTLTHTYSPPGCRTAQVVIKNYVSTVTLRADASVQDKLSPFTLVVKYRPPLPLNGVDQAGAGIKENEFPSNRDLKLYPKFSSGILESVDGYQLTAESISYVWVCNSTDVKPGDPVVYKIQATGVYKICITAFNKWGNESSCTTVVIGDTCHGINIDDGRITTKPEQVKSFTITFDKVGTNSCIAIDFGDGGVWQLYGKKEDCDNVDVIKKMKIPANVNTNYKNTFTASKLTVSNKYRLDGVFVIKVTGANYLTANTKTLQFSVSQEEQCKRPNITIHNARPIENATLCERGSRCKIRAIVFSIDCKPGVNMKSWEMAQVDNNNVVTRKIDLSSVVGHDSLYIELPAHFASLGVYRMTLTVKMTGKNVKNQQILSTAETYIYVVKGPIYVSMVEGGATALSLGRSVSIELNPAKYSVDTDANAPNRRRRSAGQMRFLWFARLTNEDDIEPTSTTLISYTPSAGSHGGCFGNGAGRINIPETTGLFKPNFAQMPINGTCNITVLVKVGTRTGRASMLIKSVEGKPPLIIIVCSDANACTKTPFGQRLIRPSSMCKLKVKCSANCPTNKDFRERKAVYKWNIMYLYMNKSISSFCHVPFKYNDPSPPYIGEESVEVTLLDNLFPAYPSDMYQAVVSLTLNGAVGYVTMNFTLNKAPVGGDCSITPTTGTFRSTRFIISGKGWRDDGRIVSYKVFIKTLKTNGQPSRQTRKFVQEFDTGDDPGQFQLTSDLRSGYMKVIVRVIDNEGAYTHCTAGNVKVEKASISTKDLTGELPNIMDAGNPSVVAEHVTIFAECVNTKLGSASIIGDPASNANLTSDQQTLRTEATANMEFILDEVDRDGTNLSPRDMVEMTLAITEQPASTDRQTDRKVKKFLRRAVNAVLEDTESSNEDRIEMLGKLLAVNLKKGEGEKCNQRKPTTRSKKEAEKKARPDMSLPKGGKYFNGDPTKEKETSITTTNSDLSSTQSNEQFKEMKKLRDDCRQLMVQLAPTGGVPTEVVVGDIVIVVSKNEIGEAKPLSVDSEGVTANVPTLCEQVPDLPICDNPHAISSISAVTSARSGFIASPGASGAPHDSSPVLDLTYQDGDGNEILGVSGDHVNIPFEIKLGLNTLEQAPAQYPNMSHGDPYTSISIKAEYPPKGDGSEPGCDYTASELFFRIIPKPYVTDKAYMVFLAFDGRVNLTNMYYNTSLVVPNWAAGKGLVPWLQAETDPFTITLDAVAKKTQQEANDPCTVYIGIRELDPTELQNYKADGTPPTVNNATLAKWKAKKGNITANVTISSFSQTCQYLVETPTQRWSTAGCKVVPEKCTRSKISCNCNHLTSFAGGWVVVPNKLDFNYIFANMDFSKNPTVYATLITIVCVYLIAAIICRRVDIKDIEKDCVYPLVDNDPADKYMYEVIVASGMSKGSGTQSKVFFIISGESDETDVRILHDREQGNKHCLDTGSIDSFLLTTPRPLGDLNYARIWHDNSGKGKFASWYLKYFLVHDLQTKKKYQFILNRWLAVEEDDGQIDRLIPVAGKEQMVEFGHLFSQTSRKNLGDEHLWFSLVGRPPRSRFTRLQRCSCCFQLLCLTMLTNAMFYGISDNEKPNTNALEIGPFTLSPTQISVGVMSNLVIFPATFLTVWLFRKTRPRKKRKSRIQEAVDKMNKKSNKDIESETSASVSDVNADVNKNNEVEICEALPDHPPPYMENDMTDLQKSINDLENQRPDSPPDSPDGKIGIPMEDPLIKKKKKKFSLPWYCRLISWTFLMLTVAVGITFSLFYGIQFGEEKCKKWITSMMVAFIMSVFITQPIKVFLLALFFSLIIKKTDDDDDDEEDEEEVQLQYDEQWVNQPNSQGTFGAAKPRTIAYKPPDPAILEKYRNNRLKEIKMYDIIKEIISYCLFIWILLSVSYSFRDPDSFNLKQEMVKVFIQNNPKNATTDYRKITDFKGYWDWTKEVLLPALLVDPYYDHVTNYGQPYGQRGFISDRAQRHMGYAVMRQLRAKPDSCVIEKVMKQVINECVEGYGIFSQEERTYGVGWTEYNKTTNNTREEYIYTPAGVLDGLPYLGNLAIYSGGGYVLRLQGSDKEMMDGVNRLMEEHWLDAHTRAIFVEFTTYNPFANLFAVCVILTEFPGSTAMVNTFRFDAVNLLGDYHGNGKWYEVFCQVSYCLFLLYFVYREIKALMKDKMAYFKHLWNINELLIIGLSFAAIGIYVYRYFVTKGLVTTFARSHGLAYIKFQYVASWNELLLYIVGWLVFLANLKFLRLLRFNKRMGILGSVLRYCRKDLFAFGIMFAIIFFAFVQFFYLLFLRDLVGYKSFVASAETSINIMLGKFNFKAMLEASPVLAPLFFFLFVLSIVMILINMFMSILNETFTIVKNDISKQSNDYEMVDFIMTRFKTWTGIGRNQAQAGPPDDEATLNNQREGGNGPPVPFEKQIDNFPDKIDKLLNSISKVYFDHDKIDALLDPSKMGAEGKAAMKMMMKQQQEQEKDNQARAVAFKNIHVPMPDVESVEK